jgi:DnaK suppressor protein
MPKSQPAKSASNKAKPAAEKVAKAVPSGKAAKPAPEAKAPKAEPKAEPKRTAKPAGKEVEHANDKPKKANGESFVVEDSIESKMAAIADSKLSPFLRKQKERLLQLRDNILDSMNGVAKDTLRSRAEGSEASAFGMHQADAGSDAYDRDFALSLLSQEQDALYEIEEALKRVEQGTYGVCEMSGKPIAHARLEAIPFARYTVECQAQIERQTKAQRTRTPVTSLFGLTDSEEGGEGEEEEPATETKE